MTEKILDADTVSQVKEFFSQLDKPVDILLFSKENDCRSCEDTRQLASEVAAISDKIALKEYDIEKDGALAGDYHVDKTPTLIIAARENGKVTDYGMRYAGVPAGHEFGTFIKDLVLVSRRDSGLGPQMREFLGGLSKPLKFLVFFTPT